MFIEYHGQVSIDGWEYLLSFVYVTVLYIHFARIKNIAFKRDPIYRYYLWGLVAKIAGGVAFCMVYFYYYNGGDTVLYYYSAVAMSNLAWAAPMDYLDMLLGAPTPERMAYFTEETARPFAFMYYNERNSLLVKMVSVISIFTFNSYLVTTVVVASISYSAVWNCFRSLVRHFPALTGKLALAFLFMPSVVFWGSGIMKDTFTFSALCALIHCVDAWFFQRRRALGLVVLAIMVSAVLIGLKPYIFMAILPLLTTWVLYRRLSGLRNALVRFVLLPIGFTLLFAGLALFMSWLGDSLDKFSTDSLLDTIVVTKNDMQREEEYGTNYFDIGTIEPTWSSVLSKIPIALTAALYMPFIWQASNVVMLISSLENMWLLLLTVRVMLQCRILGFFRYMFGSPFVLMCFGFVALFGAGIGLSTPNFGALVRFKIPLVPLLVTGLYLMQHFERRARDMKAQGARFRLRDYMDGDPDPVPPASGRMQRADRARHAMRKASTMTR